MQNKTVLKVAVIGSRKFYDYNHVKKVLDAIYKKHPLLLIVSGGAKGTDSLGEKWADNHNIEKLIFPANWMDLTHPNARIKINRYGKKYDANAGFRRNKDIIDNADVVIAFWDGNSPGTKNSIDYATKLKKQIKIFNI